MKHTIFTRQLWEAILKKPNLFKRTARKSLKEDRSGQDSIMRQYIPTLQIDQKKKWLINFFKNISYRDLEVGAINRTEYVIYPKSEIAQNYLRDYYKDVGSYYTGMGSGGNRIYQIQGKATPVLLPIYFDNSGVSSKYARRINSPNGIPDFLKNIGLGAKCYLAATKIYGYVMSNDYARSHEASKMWAGLERYALRTGDFVIVHTKDNQQILAATGSGLKNAIKELRFNYDDIIPEQSKMPGVYIKYLKQIDSNYDDYDYNYYDYDDYDNEDEDVISSIEEDPDYDTFKEKLMDFAVEVGGIPTVAKYWDQNSLPVLSLRVLMGVSSTISLKTASELCRFPDNPIPDVISRKRNKLIQLCSEIRDLYIELKNKWDDIPIVPLHMFRGRLGKELSYGAIVYFLKEFGIRYIADLMDNITESSIDDNITQFEKLYLYGETNRIINPVRMANIVENGLNNNTLTKQIVTPFLKLAPNVFDELSDELKEQIKSYK